MFCVDTGTGLFFPLELLSLHPSEDTTSSLSLIYHLRHFWHPFKSHSAFPFWTIQLETPAPAATLYTRPNELCNDISNEIWLTQRLIATSRYCTLMLRLYLHSCNVQCNRSTRRVTLIDLCLIPSLTRPLLLDLKITWSDGKKFSFTFIRSLFGHSLTTHQPSLQV